MGLFGNNQYANHLVKQDNLTRKNKDEAKTHFINLNWYLIVRVLGHMLSFGLPIGLLVLDAEQNWIYAIATFSLVRGLMLLLHEDRENFLRLSLVLIISGVTFIVTEFIKFDYMAILLLSIPVTLYIDNRSRKYLYLPTIFFVGIAVYLFVTFTEYYILSWVALLPLLLFYYHSRYKVSSKATYLGELSAYQLRKQREKEQKKKL